MNKAICKLEWDSDFFGLNIYSINENITTINVLEDVFLQLSEYNADLAYYFSPQPLKDLQNISEIYDITLVDKKITYKKTINIHSIFDNSVHTYKEQYPELKLIQLSIQSGIYSRFNVDKRIGKPNFEKLYKQWMINSVNKSIAKEVLIYKIDDTIAGFITLGEKNAIGDIGIVAVDEIFRGKGIGKSLINSAEKWFLDNNYKEIQVVTQGDNLPACRLYQTCGFNIVNEGYYYHAWKKEHKGL